MLFSFLFVILTSTLFSSSLPSVEAKKEIYKTPPVKEAIPHIRCLVCEHSMYQVVRNTLDYIADKKAKKASSSSSSSSSSPSSASSGLLKLKEELLIDNVLDPLCVPYTPGGAWLRSSDWEPTFVHPETKKLLPADTSDVATSVHFQLKKGRDYRCGERCSTAAAACDDMMMTDDVQDKIASTLIKSFKKLLAHAEKEEREEEDQEETKEEKEQSEVVKIAQDLVKSVCQTNKKWKNCQKKKIPKSKKEAVLSAPRPVEMENKEVEIEEMMYRMKNGLKKNDGSADDEGDSLNQQQQAGGGGPAGNPGVDVYSKDEMMQMREALTSGNKEALKQIDPTAEDLSDEEFAMLQKLHQKEFAMRQKEEGGGGEGGGQEMQGLEGLQGDM